MLRRTDCRGGGGETEPKPWESGARRMRRETEVKIKGSESSGMIHMLEADEYC